MRFTTARLCGGKALMAISSDMMDIDMGRARETVAGWGCRIIQEDDMMLLFEWKGMETTLYPTGKVMFFPLEDKAACIRYATEILEQLR